MRQAMNESYEVKLARGGSAKSFDALKDAVDYINAGMKNRDSDTFILYNDNKEMIWLDFYRDEERNGVGYTISRQEDKESVAFDKQKGLLIKNNVEDDESIRAMVVKEAGRMKYYQEASKLAKFRFVVDKSKPSYIDFKDNCVHYNTNGQLNDNIEEIVKQLNAKNESLEVESLKELFGLGKKAKQKRYIVGISAGNHMRDNNVDQAKLSKAVKAIINKEAKDVKTYAGVSATGSRNYFSYATIDNYEFTCTEEQYQAIKRKVNGMPLTQVAINANSLPQRPYVNNHIYWGTVASKIKEELEESLNESLEMAADNWYRMNW